MDSRAAHSNGTTTTAAAAAGSPKHKRRVPLDYTHTKQIDTTYRNPNENPRTAKKIRVTTSAQGEVLDTIVKENLGHLNVYSPKTAFDWRISINNERKGWTSVILFPCITYTYPGFFFGPVVRFYCVLLLCYILPFARADE